MNVWRLSRRSAALPVVATWAPLSRPQGKTLQVISLILAQPPAGVDYIAKVRAVEANKRLKEQLDRGELTAPPEVRVREGG